MGIKFGISALVLLLNATAFAADVKGYNCNLRIIAADNEMVIEEAFTAEMSAGTHGDRGATTFKSKDSKTVATVAIDGKWMILNWVKNGKGVANIVFVVENPSQESRVAIAYNPENLEEQAALNCEPKLMLK